jgi:hypothetical protein
MLFLWQGLRQWSARRREQRFKRDLLAVGRIERQALELEGAAELDLGKLRGLQQQLNDLKDEALRKFASGELEGEQLVAGFLTLVNDARHYITRLILHQRENVGPRAAGQGRKPQEVWLESLGD